MEQKNKKRTALGLVGAGALKSLLSDYPKGVIEDFTRAGVKAKFDKQPAMKKLLSKKFLGKAFSGTGVGRAAGGMTVGAATFPIFYSGMKDLKSGDKDRRAKGFAKVIGSGVLFQGGKGAVEYGWKALRGKKGVGKATVKNPLPPKATKSLKALTAKGMVGRGTAARALIGLGASTATAYGLSKALSKPKDGKKKKSVLPAALALGAGMGAGKGLIDTAMLGRSGKWWNPKSYAAAFKSPKAWVPGTVARAAGGAVGTAVLGELLDRLMKPKKQKLAMHLRAAHWLGKAALQPIPKTPKLVIPRKWYRSADDLKKWEAKVRLRIGALADKLDKKLAPLDTVPGAEAGSSSYYGFPSSLRRVPGEVVRHPDSLLVNAVASVVVPAPLAGPAAMKKYIDIKGRLGLDEAAARKILEKLAGVKEKYTPYPHQQVAVDKFLEGGQLILAHGTGSGKTFTAIASFEEARKQGKAAKALIVVPAGLKDNFAKEGVEKFTDSTYQIVGSKAEQGKPNTVYLDSIGEAPYTIVSYDMFNRDPVGLMKRSGADTLVLDEFHKIRNERAKVHKSALEAREYAQNFMGLTASPINNSPAEIATLVNVATSGQYMKRSRFSNRYLRTRKVRKGFFGGKKKVKELRRQAEVAQYVRPIVDYRSSDELKDLFPRKNVKVVDTPMSAEQQEKYDYIMGQLGPIKQMITRKNVQISDKEMAHIFSKIINARRLLNDASAIGGSPKETAAQDTPKIRRILEDVDAHMKETPDAKVVIYSNLIRGGLDVVAQGLKQKGVPFGAFIGSGRSLGDQTVSHATRNQAVEDYKAGKLKVLLVSGAGAEGLDLKNTTGFFSLDGHWNPERIRQAEARAVRLKGQEHRPKEKREVLVNRYRSTYPKKWYKPGRPKPTVDEWIYDVAARKHQLNTQLRHVLKVDPPKGFKTYKYTRKYRSPRTGEWVYVYPQKRKIASYDPKKEKNKKHKFIGPALASMGTGATMGAALGKGHRLRSAGAGAAAGAVNAMLWRAIVRGYSKAVDVPYRDVVS